MCAESENPLFSVNYACSIQHYEVRCSKCNEESLISEEEEEDNSSHIIQISEEIVALL